MGCRNTFGIRVRGVEVEAQEWIASAQEKEKKCIASFLLCITKIDYSDKFMKLRNKHTLKICVAAMLAISSCILAGAAVLLVPVRKQHRR